MEIKTTPLKRCTLLEVNGRIDSSTAPRLADIFNEITEGGEFHIVFDMGNVEFISSAGLWVMVTAQKKCKRFNRGEVYLAGVPKRIHEAFDLAGFIPYFKVFDSSAEAVGSF
ncbi:MAG: STAS domain-containing protein [Pelolinea sp.]|jgi:anti-sigma B factor antagonist|nr:STAS domain-containing protein [Pelolinea sp.]